MGKEEPFDSTEEAHSRTCTCSSIGRWEPAKEWARREGERATLTEKRTYLYYRTALHCAGRAVLVLGGVLWALGHNPRPIKEEKIEPRDSRTTTRYAQPVQTNRLGGSATKIDVEMGGD